MSNTTAIFGLGSLSYSLLHGDADHPEHPGIGARTETPALLHLHHCEVQLAYGQVLPAMRPLASTFGCSQRKSLFTGTISMPCQSISVF